MNFGMRSSQGDTAGSLTAARPRMARGFDGVTPRLRNGEAKTPKRRSSMSEGGY